ncbi:Transglutaminase-like enzyme, putative cysteine protease [Desulfuromusa kysingii]|uniref:Transglutaminase-like enzyme, putative cysteine protease n=1 Tax=Desulfuromusa kysingii TaxID=37625 RepID=A0A1H4BXK8_9BACT|nr:transglutaminase family protein [Desulfuromusa kysingii]SEA52819.1 Transglutaminase-like enzyme, putative cysteine protease [Desulfuromusa kysingii]
MNFRVKHATQYTYSEPVSLCRNEACLLIRETPWQHCISSELQIDPAPSDLRQRLDPFGNRINHFAIQHPHNKLVVTALSEVSVCSNPNILVSANQFSWETTKARLHREWSEEVFAALPFLYDSPFAQRSPQLEAYARTSFPPDRPLGEATFDLMQRIYHEFKYDPGFSTISTPLSKVLSERRGVCQDFAHLGVACLRSIGLAARYVSGYIETLPPAGQERLVGADASHAWFSVYVADLGWVDFDPTNNKLLSDQHITVAWGRDFSDVSPLRGVALGGGKHKVSVSVDVARQPAGLVG